MALPAPIPTVPDPAQLPLHPALEQLEARLAATALGHSHELTLARGMAGVLLMATRMAQLLPTPQRRARVTRLAGAIADALGACAMDAGLWSGVVGVLYALEYIRAVDPSLLGEHEDAVREFVADMDEVLAGAAHAHLHFDLVSGQCGIGAYALVRTDTGAARRIFAGAEQALRDSAERDASYCAWRAPSGIAAHAGYDLGVAHGVPGVIGLLAHALRLGIATEHTALLLDHSLRWLRAHEDRSLPHARFASVTSRPHESSRLAWCYGDLGIAAVLSVAVGTSGEVALARWWRTLAGQRIEQAATSWRLADDALCHGRAGVLHILRGLLAHGLDSQAARYAAAEFETTLAQSIGAAHKLDNYGLLEGWSGVVLALAESTLGQRARGRPWNLCLLTPA